MSETIETLYHKMEAAAFALHFEEAKRCRDKICILRAGAKPAEADEADFAGPGRQSKARWISGQPAADDASSGLAATTQPKSADIGPVKAGRALPAVTANARDMTLALLASRSPNATVCPSEVARAIAPNTDWRDAMPTVHSAVDRLVDEETVQLSWKGHALVRRDGPYRIGRGSHSQV